MKMSPGMVQTLLVLVVLGAVAFLLLSLVPDAQYEAAIESIKTWFSGGLGAFWTELTSPRGLMLVSIFALILVVGRIVYVLVKEKFK